MILWNVLWNEWAKAPNWVSCASTPLLVHRSMLCHWAMLAGWLGYCCFVPSIAFSLRPSSESACPWTTWACCVWVIMALPWWPMFKWSLYLATFSLAGILWQNITKKPFEKKNVWGNWQNWGKSPHSEKQKAFFFFWY